MANLHNGKILDDNETVSPPLPPNNDVILSLSYGEPAFNLFPSSPFPPWLEPDTHRKATLKPVSFMSSNPPGPRPVKTFQKIQGWGATSTYFFFLLHGDVIARTY